MKVLISGILIALSITTANAGAFVVTNTAASGAGSLFAAVTSCNAAPAGPHTITFDPSMDGQSIPSIGATAISASNVVIDGTTMPGYSCGNPRVLINCPVSNGWQFTGTNVTIKGVRIFGGLALNGTGAHKVYSCLFNINFGGTAMTAPVAQGTIRINSGTSINNIIGGLSSCEKNVFAAEGARAIYIDASGNGQQILGNYMGTDITGLVALGSGFTSRVIEISNGSNHTIDGNTMGNVINSAQGMAIFVNGGSSHTIRNNNIGANVDRLFIAGMRLGVGPAGSMAVYFNGNGDNSIFQNNVVGNVKAIVASGISGNVVTLESVDNMQVLDNYIGCDINFNNGGSAWAGLYIYSGCVGGTISGNYVGFNGITGNQRSHGIAFLDQAGTTTISNNYIGVTPSGGNMGNGDAGLEMNDPAAGAVFNVTGNYIGFNRCMRKTAPGSLASESGAIRMVSPETVTISNNYIGTLAGGRTDCGNLWNGIVIEGATGVGVTISNNVIAYNDRNAFQNADNTPDKILIRQNCIFCNSNEGIELSSVGGSVANSSHGRNFATVDGAKNVQISTAGPWLSNFAGSPWVLRGYAPAGNTVEIFQIHHCGCDGTNQTSTVDKVNGAQGLDYIGSVIADAQGRWTYNVAANTVKNGFTVTASDLTLKRTSEFSPCVSVTPTCLPPTSVSVSATDNTPCVGDPFTVSGSATFIRTSCYNNIYYTWLKDGAVIYGPNLTYVDWVDAAAADPADDGTYTLRVEDGNAGVAACYLQNSTVIDVNCPPLNVSLVSFKAQPKSADYNELSWVLETDEFGNVEVQKSLDGKDFTTFDTRYFYGSNMNEVLQDAEDSPIMYYRLKISPSASPAFYSKAIVVSKTTSLQINVLHPTDEWLNLEVVSSVEENVNYSIYDSRGVVVAQSNFFAPTGVSKQRIYVGGLASAVYIIKCEGSNYNNTDRELFVK